MSYLRHTDFGDLQRREAAHGVVILVGGPRSFGEKPGSVHTWLNRDPKERSGP